uniref:Wbp11/ELF5/Saf1 N-terminal domain-containing protein n=1 Tax=Neogobius melanostomus TaxID=47308 RepID=A0A8C6WE95_9GOBI
MGRRSTSSTKSGKFMNPTDQARKCPFTFKQRMMVRAAVLKMKDPRQIIRDMEKLDEMEFNPVQQPLLNEKVLRDKRKKLRETFERIVRLYERENPEMYKELRKLELDYETKRGQLALYFDSVKVSLSTITNPIQDPNSYILKPIVLATMPCRLNWCIFRCLLRTQSPWRWTAFLYRTCLTLHPTSTSRTSHCLERSRRPS